MDFILRPWHLLILAVSSWINREQENVIEYLLVENQVLREKLGKGRISLNNDQRRRLAVSGKLLGRKVLSQFATIVTPDTILRWHRQLIAQKWDYSERRKSVGRPKIEEATVDLILRMVKENEGWGYDHIQGALRNLGLTVSDTTVGKVLREHGIEPAPKRQKRTTWRAFLKSHWEVMGAADFRTVEVWTKWGLVSYYILIVMKLSTRRIEVAGITTNPNAAWMQQMGRNLTDYDDGFPNDIEYLLLDRDTKFLPFSGTLEGTDTEVVLLPPRSPNLNAFVERYMRTMKSECLNKMIFFGENSLRKALVEFTEHYHHERNHQGLENNIIDFKEETTSTTGTVRRRERLGGMLSYYYRDVA